MSPCASNRKRSCARSKKRYRNLVENAPFPIVISRIDDGIILYLNPQAARKLTVSRTYILANQPGHSTSSPRNGIS